MAGGCESQLAELRQMLEVPVIGHPRRGASSAELRRLVEKYVAEMRRNVAGPHSASKYFER